MKANIKYFGMIAEKLNRESEILEIVPGMNLKAFIENKYPELKEMKFKIAINQELREEIKSGEEDLEIAVLPPFAGG